MNHGFAAKQLIKILGQSVSTTSITTSLLTISNYEDITLDMCRVSVLFRLCHDKARDSASLVQRKGPHVRMDNCELSSYFGTITPVVKLDENTMAARIHATTGNAIVL